MDKVARTMGDMLLKGYRMLATSCETCNTILMQDKHGRILCISCDDKKKNEQPTFPINVDECHEGATSLPVNGAPAIQQKKLLEGTSNGSLYRVLSFNQRVLMEQMKFTADTLESGQETMDIQAKILHVKFIQQCAEAIAYIQKMDF